jgi:hypothetical protein
MYLWELVQLTHHGKRTGLGERLQFLCETNIKISAVSCNHVPKNLANQKIGNESFVNKCPFETSNRNQGIVADNFWFCFLPWDVSCSRGQTSAVLANRRQLFSRTDVSCARGQTSAVLADRRQALKNFALSEFDANMRYSDLESVLEKIFKFSLQIL